MELLTSMPTGSWRRRDQQFWALACGGSATRYDNLAVRYEAASNIATINNWLRPACQPGRGLLSRLPTPRGCGCAGCAFVVLGCRTVWCRKSPAGLNVPGSAGLNAMTRGFRHHDAPSRTPRHPADPAPTDGSTDNRQVPGVSENSARPERDVVPVPGHVLLATMARIGKNYSMPRGRGAKG